MHVPVTGFIGSTLGQLAVRNPLVVTHSIDARSLPFKGDGVAERARPRIGTRK